MKKEKNKKCPVCHCYLGTSKFKNNCVCIKSAIGRMMPIMYQRLYGCKTVHAGQKY